MKFLLLFVFSFYASGYTPSNDKSDTFDFLSSHNLSVLTITAPLTVTGTTILETSLSGFLKATSGIVSSQALIDLTSDVSGIVPVANGGTNSSTALNNNLVMISSAGSIIESSTTITQLGFLDATSSIQTQIDSKITNSAGLDGQVLTLTASVPTWEDATGGSGGSGSGDLTYILDDNSNLEETIGSWLSYADAAGENPVDGTAGSATTTCTRNTTAPLFGVGDLLLTKDASDRQGEGCSLDFTITDQTYIDSPTRMWLRMRHKSDTNYSAGDIKVFLYDKDTSSLIENVISVTNQEMPAGETVTYFGFQTNVGSDDYRAIIHISTTNALAYNIQIDDVLFGPLTKATGASRTDTLEFSPSGSWTTNSTYSGNWSQDGENVTVRYMVTLSGAPNVTTLNFNLPNSMVVDSGKLKMANNISHVQSSGEFRDASSGRRHEIRCVYNDSNGKIQPVYSNNSTVNTNIAIGITNVLPVTMATGDTIECTTTVPIVGLSSNVQYSQAFSNADLEVEGRGNGGTVLVALVTDIDFTETSDDSGSWNGTTFIAKRKGTFRISGGLRFASAVTNADIYSYINGVQDKLIGFFTGVHNTRTFNGDVNLKVGDQLTIRSGVAGTLFNNSIYHNIAISDKGTNQSLLETETIYSIYEDDSGQAINTTLSIVSFNTLIDSSNSSDFDGTTYTMPKNGCYQTNYGVTSAALAVTNGQQIQCRLKKNSVDIGIDFLEVTGTNGSYIWRCRINQLVCGKKGDELEFHVDSSISGTLQTNGYTNTFTIHRIK